MGVKLPKLDVPTFNGDILTWKILWEQFRISVHGRSTLSDSEKLQHALKDSTAKCAIEGLSRSGEHSSHDTIDCIWSTRPMSTWYSKHPVLRKRNSVTFTTWSNSIYVHSRPWAMSLHLPSLLPCLNSSWMWVLCLSGRNTPSHLWMSFLIRSYMNLLI